MTAAIEKTLGTEQDVGFMTRLRSEFGFIHGNFLILILSWLVLDFFSEMPSTYYPLYVKALGGTAVTIGLIGSAGQIATALVQVPGGYLADKYGRKWLITSMTFVAGLSWIFYILAQSWHWILIGSVIGGLCAIYRPALTAIVADSVPTERRGMGFSIVNLITSVSTTPAPIIAGILFTRLGLVPSMRLGYTLALVGFLIAASFRLRLKETVKSPDRIELSQLLSLYPRSIKESVSVWKIVHKGAFILFVVHIILNFSSGLFQPILALYVIEYLGISPVEFSLILTTLFVSMIILAIPTGKVIDRVGKRGPLLAGFILWGVASLLFIYGDFYRLLVAMSIVGLVVILINAAGSALTADLVSHEHRGKVNGSRGFFSLLALSAGQFLGGYLYESFSPKLPWLLQMILAIPPILLILLYVKEPEIQE